MPLPPAIDRFTTDVTGELGLGVALQLEEALEAIDLEGDGNPDACAFLMAIEWIAAHRERTVMERIEAIDKLRHLKGRNVVDLKQFTGWA